MTWHIFDKDNKETWPDDHVYVHVFRGEHDTEVEYINDSGSWSGRDREQQVLCWHKCMYPEPPSDEDYIKYIEYQIKKLEDNRKNGKTLNHKFWGWEDQPMMDEYLKRLFSLTVFPGDKNNKTEEIAE